MAFEKEKEAFAKGKRIQFRNWKTAGAWQDVVVPSWGQGTDYRIHPDDVEPEQEKPKMQPHPHAAVIRAYADGASIEHRPDPNFSWQPIANPSFFTIQEYRVKPTNTVRYVAVLQMPAGSLVLSQGVTSEDCARQCAGNFDKVASILRIELDPDTGKLVSATQL